MLTHCWRSNTLINMFWPTLPRQLWSLSVCTIPCSARNTETRLKSCLCFSVCLFVVCVFSCLCVETSHFVRSFTSVAKVCLRIVFLCFFIIHYVFVFVHSLLMFVHCLFLFGCVHACLCPFVSYYHPQRSEHLGRAQGVSSIFWWLANIFQSLQKITRP